MFMSRTSHLLNPTLLGRLTKDGCQISIVSTVRLVSRILRPTVVDSDKKYLLQRLFYIARSLINVEIGL